MSARGASSGQRARRPPARNLCRCFEGTMLVGSARPGLDALEAEHKPLVLGGDRITCGVALDRARRHAEPQSTRWDYVFVERDTHDAVGVEVHHAAPEEVPVMIAKKKWADALLQNECAAVRVRAWLWIAPEDGPILFSRLHPHVRLLAEDGIQFPTRSLRLP